MIVGATVGGPKGHEAFQSEPDIRNVCYQMADFVAALGVGTLHDRQQPWLPEVSFRKYRKSQGAWRGTSIGKHAQVCHSNPCSFVRVRARTLTASGAVSLHVERFPLQAWVPENPGLQFVIIRDQFRGDLALVV